MKTHFITFLLLVGMSLGISSRLHAQSSYQPGEENLKAREEFQDINSVFSFIGDCMPCLPPVSGL